MRNLRLGALASFAIGAVSACFLGGGSNGDGSDAAPSVDAGQVLPFQADPPQVYVAKVKNVLTGLPPTADEISTVTNASDPRAALQGLIKSWQTAPQTKNDVYGIALNAYQLKLLRFFQLAFQQVQITNKDVETMLGQKTVTKNSDVLPSIMSNLQTSFAMTMMMQSIEGTQSFKIAPSTTTFAMTTALMEFYGFLDAMQINDDGSGGKADGTLLLEQPAPNGIGMPATVTLTSDVVPISESASPGANWMRWTNPQIAKQCTGTSGTLPMSAFNLHQAVYGWWDGVPQGGGCKGSFLGTASTSVLQPQHFADWRLVTIKTDPTPSHWTAWWDVAALSNTSTATSLTLRVPRVGFFTTPAFFANWPTNDSNQMRVTMNQTFIVALGAGVDGTDPTQTSPSVPGLAVDHTGTTGACYGCHQLLDPSRGPLMSTYSWFYHAQDQTKSPYNGQADAGFAPPPGGYTFAFQGQVTPNITTVDQLGAQLSSHPNFAGAWAEKFCLWANSAGPNNALPCNPQDKTFGDVVAQFASDGDFNAMVVNLMSSPIITNASQTSSEQSVGEIVTVARRDHLCASLNQRLGFQDLCGTSGFDAAALNTTVTAIANGLPSDTYGRGAATPSLPSAPTMFSWAANQDICEQVAVVLVDNAALPTCTSGRATVPCSWSSASQAAVSNAIHDFVTVVMGIADGDADPRYAQATSALSTFYGQAVDAAYPDDGGGTISPTVALQATFSTACQSPSAVSIGM